MLKYIVYLQKHGEICVHGLKKTYVTTTQSKEQNLT